MRDIIFTFYGYAVFFYSMALMASYIALMWLALYSLHKRFNSLRNLPYVRRLLKESPYTPGVSIVAPAYNEAETVVTDVLSFLDQDYPCFEVVIVNDGSKDDTLKNLIEHFSLVKVPYIYVERIVAKPFRALYRSTKPEYGRLTVVDKENGGTKADAVNAGLNVAMYPYFVNTDVDCILSPDAIYNCIRPVLEQKHVIAVSGVMTMSNGCTVHEGHIVKRAAPWSPLPLFQIGEYMRSFLLGKMGWSAINAMNNVSGGYGLFDKHVAIAAGGYGGTSFAEDMDMLIRMVGYCCDTGRPYRVVQIADTCCYTEGPPNLKQIIRQRVRWGRGLLQTFSQHYHMMFRRKYRQLGMLTLPYTFVFELLAPVIELVGFITFIYLILIHAVNWTTAVVIFGLVFIFGLLLSIVVILYDYLVGGSYDTRWSYLRQFLASIFEPFLYHPLIVCCSLKGYWNYLSGKKAVWGEMKRKGAKEQK